MSVSRSIAVALSAVMSLAMAAIAEPVPDQDRIPLDLRRTTLVVADIERSLAFYRDTLGMVPFYDNIIRTPRDAADTDAAEVERRLVFLRANDTYIGVLGLLEYTKPVKAVDPQDRTPFQPGDVVLLFNAEDAEAAFAAAAALDTIEVVSEPQVIEYPDYDGDGTIRVKISIVLDPDGHAIELNQLLSELH